MIDPQKTRQNLGETGDIGLPVGKEYGLDIYSSNK